MGSQRRLVNRHWRCCSFKLVLNVLAVCVAITAFLYQVSFNVKLFLEIPTVTTVSLERPDSLRLPPVTVCPSPAFNTTHLKDQGLDIETTLDQILLNIETFEGVDRSRIAGEMWKKSGFHFRDFIRSIRITGELEETYYSNSTSDYWHKSLTPFGPCWTLESLPIQKHNPIYYLYIELRKNHQPERCFWMDDENRTQHFYSCDLQKPQLKEYCNSTCGWEKVSPSFTFFILAHKHDVLKDHNIGNVKTFVPPDVVFDGQHKGFFLQNNDVTLDVGMREQYNVKNCEKRPSYSSRSCYLHCLTKHMRKISMCLPFSQEVMFDTIESVCASKKQIMKLFDYSDHICQDACKQPCNYAYWTLNHQYSDSAPKVRIRMPLPTLHREVQSELYSASHLLSDTGGSLGLFLGLSFLTLWKWILRVIEIFATRELNAKRTPRPDASVDKVWSSLHDVKQSMACDKGQQKYCTTWNEVPEEELHSYLIYHRIARMSKHFRLINSLGTLILVLIASVHSLVSFQSYLDQPIMTTVTRGSTTLGFDRYCDPGTIGIGWLHDLMAQRLSSRALGCVPPLSSSRYRECLLNCAVKKMAYDINGFLSYTDVRDLPRCSQNTSKNTCTQYIVPGDALAAATNALLIDDCNRTCVKEVNTWENSSVTESDVLRVNPCFLRQNIFWLLNRLFGIWTLYLGMTCFQLLDDAQNILVHLYRETRSCKVLTIISKVLKLIFGLLGSAYCISLVYRFICYHPYTSSRTFHQPGASDRPDMTICRWPPFNVTRLSLDLGLTISRKELQGMSPRERFEFIWDKISTFQGNWSFPLDELWRRSAWNLTDLIIHTYIVFRNNTASQSINYWKPVMTDLNRCFTFPLSELSVNMSELNFYSPIVTQDTSILGSLPQIYLGLHRSGGPALLHKMKPRNTKSDITVTYSFGKFNYKEYKKLRKKPNKDHFYDTCVHRCIHDKYCDLVKCRLPFVTWRPDLLLCNQSQYVSYPKGTLRNGIQASLGIKDVLEEHVIDECSLRCHPRRIADNIYYHLEVANVFSMHPYARVTLKHKDYETIHIEDLYSLPQLLSDVGGLLGLVGGVSVLSLLQSSISWMFRP